MTTPHSSPAFVIDAHNAAQNLVVSCDGMTITQSISTSHPKSVIRSKATEMILSFCPDATMSDTTTPTACDVGTYALKWNGNSVEIFEITETDYKGWFYTSKMVTPVLKCKIYITGDTPVETPPEVEVETTVTDLVFTPEPIADDAEKSSLFALQPLFTVDDISADQNKPTKSPRRNRLKNEIKTELRDEIKNEGISGLLTESTIYRVNEIVHKKYDEVIQDLRTRINELESQQTKYVELNEDIYVCNPIFESRFLEPDYVPAPARAPVDNVISFDSIIECVKNFDRSSLRSISRINE